MPISKAELIDLVALDELNPSTTSTTKTKSTQSIDLDMALRIKQFLAIETDHQPIYKKQKKEDAEVIIILDDD